MPDLLRNGCFHGAHETCRLLVVIFNCAVIISDQACPVVHQQQKTCNSVRTDNAKQIERARFIDINSENGKSSIKLCSGRN
jgi:hypothetical protein